jgi:membrane fusion protein (multidrug efflux system)
MPARDRVAPPTEAAPVNVKVITVAAEPEFADTFELPAVVEPNRVVTVSAEIDGRAQVKRDRIEFERMKNLVEDDATSRRDLDNATTQLAVSQAQLKEVGARLELTRILAPIDGVLNELFIEEGEYVQAGMPVGVIVETDMVKVVVEVPERDIAFFAVGQKAGVSVNVKGRDRSLAGTITFISGLADERTRCTRMELTFENKERLLRSGQIVSVNLTRRVLKDAVLIPLLAVIPMENGKAVYVVNSAKAHRRDVELGIIKGNRIQVTRGLEPGDRLIVSGHRFVAPGQNVSERE